MSIHIVHHLQSYREYFHLNKMELKEARIKRWKTQNSTYKNYFWEDIIFSFAADKIRNTKPFEFWSFHLEITNYVAYICGISFKQTLTHKNIQYAFISWASRKWSEVIKNISYDALKDSRILQKEKY